MDRKRIRRGLVRGLVVGAASICALVAAFVLVLSSTPAGTHVVNRVLSGVATVPGGRVTVREVGGNWVTRLDAFDVRLTRGDTVLAAADTVRVRARPLSLLRGRIDLAGLEVGGLFLSRNLARASGGAADTASTGWQRAVRGRAYHGPALRLDRVAVRDGTYGEAYGRTAGAELTHISLEAHDVHLAGDVGFSLDHLTLRYTPAAPDSAATDLWLSGALSTSGIDVDSLRIAGPHSDVSGRAALTFDVRDDVSEMVVELHARPLDLADLGMIPGMPRMTGRVAADVELRGPRVADLKGTGHVRWGGIDVAGVGLDTSRVDLVLAGGRADVTGSVTYDGARADVRGWIRPLAAPPDYELHADFNALPRALRVAASPPSRRAGIHISGKGFGDADVRFDGTVTDAVSRVEWAGRVSLQPEPEWVVQRLAFDHVDLATWAEGLTATDISGTLAARGRGLDPSALHATAAWELAASRVGPGRLESASGRAALAGRRMGTSLRIEAGVGVIALDTVTVTLGSGGAAGTVRVARSMLRGRVVDEAEADFDVRGGTGKVSARLVTDAGAVEVRASMRSAGTRRELAVDEGRFEDIDVGAWSRGLPPTRLSGFVSGRMTMGGGAAPAASAVLHIDPSRISGRDVAGGDITATLANDHLKASGHVDVGPDSVTVAADFARSHAGGPQGWVRGVVPLTLLASLARGDTVAAAGEVRVEARYASVAPAEPARTIVRVDGAGEYGDWTLDSILASVHLVNGAVVVDTLALRSNAGNVDATGRMARPGASGSNLNATIEVSNAAALRSLLGAGADDSAVKRSILRMKSASARLDLRGDSLGVDVDARFDDDHRVTASATAALDADTLALRLTDAGMQAGKAQWRLARAARFRLSRDRLSVDGLEVRETSAAQGRLFAIGTIDRRGEQDFTIDASGVGLDIVAGGLGREAIEGSLDGTLALRGPAEAPRADGTLRITPIVAGAPAGATEARVRWDGRVAELTAALTSAEGDSLTLSGRYPVVLPLAAADAARESKPADAPGDMVLRVDADRFPLSAFEPFLPPHVAADVRGHLDAHLRLAGKADAPSGSGSVGITGGGAALPSLGVEYRDVQFDGVFAGDRLTVRRATLASGNGDLSIGGEVKVAGPATIEPRLSLNARQFMFADRLDLRFIATGQVDLTGTAASPVVRGQLTLSGCTYYLPANVLGGAQSSSDVTLTPEDLAMLEETFGYKVRRNGAATRAIVDNADMDLQVSLQRDNWMRKRSSPRLALELTGDVRVKKVPGGEVELYGRIAPTPRRGYLEYFGRTFDFVGGEVLLDGRMEDHTVDMRTEYKVRPPRGSDEPDVVVTLGVQGHVDHLSLGLSSQPELTETEIVSYITTGRSPVSTQPAPDNRGADALALAADIGLSRMTGPLEEAAQKRIGLDVLQVRYDALLGATLMAGRYINPVLYIGFEQPLQNRESSSTSTQRPYQTAVELELELKRWLVINVQGEASLLRTYLRARHEY